MGFQGCYGYVINMGGLFVVFEGIDGCGKTTQIGEVERTIRQWNKYQDIVLTREPTYKADELRRRLTTETDPMANAQRMAQLFISDRKTHYQKDILSDIWNGRVVLCDRYAMSTLAYQSVQGVPMESLVKMHREAEIPAPDITFYLTLSAEEAASRRSGRGEQREKFEELEFARRLAKQHDVVYEESKKDGKIERLLGPVIRINANKKPADVSQDILTVLEPIYRSKKSN